MRPYLALLLCIGLTACGGEALPLEMGGCGLGQAIPLNVEVVRQATIVTVTMNQRRARLLLDTGANVTVINRSSASVLGIQPVAGGTSVFQAVGGASPTDRAELQSMIIGGIAVNGLKVAVSSDTLEDGVLGLDVLSRFDVDVDLPNGRVTLYRGGLCPGDKPPIPGAVLEIPAKRAITRGTGKTQVIEPYLMVPVSLEGAVTLGMFDSGALAGSLVSSAFAAKAGVTEDKVASDPVITARGFGTSTTLHRHQFDKMFIGREVFEKPTLLVGGDSKQLFPVIFGYDYFRTHRVWFNFLDDRVFVVPVNDEPALPAEGG